MSFPLFKADGRPGVRLGRSAVAALQGFQAALEKGAYRLQGQACLCGGDDPADLVVSEKDRYGLPLPSVLCGRCGLLRSARVLDGPSLRKFYEEDYRRIYEDEVPDLAFFFGGQLSRGRALRAFAGGFLKPGASVFEVGCGAGGVLKAFAEAGYGAAGCDFDQRYLDYGRAQGLDLRHGAVQDLGLKGQDAVILCHVLEHFSDPQVELGAILPVLAEGGLLIIEVPGLFSLARTYPDILGYFQAAHVYNYGSAHLKALLGGLGLEVLAADESCRVLARKPQGWALPPRRPLRFDAMAATARRARAYLGRMGLLARWGLNPWAYVRSFMLFRRACGVFLRRRGWKGAQA